MVSCIYNKKCQLIITPSSEGFFFSSDYLPNPLPIRRCYYTLFGDDGSDVAVGGDVKGGVGHGNAVGGAAYTLNMSDLFRASLLNDDFIPGA